MKMLLYFKLLGFSTKIMLENLSVLFFPEPSPKYLCNRLNGNERCHAVCLSQTVYECTDIT